MSYQPHLIAQYEEGSGLNTYYEPFLIPEKAFPVLEDAYCWRGKVKKRLGYKLLGRLRRILTSGSMTASPITSAGPWPEDITINIFVGLGIHATEPHAELQPGSVTLPIKIVLAGGPTLTDNAGLGTMSSSGGVVNSATINYATGDVVITFNAAYGPGVAAFSGAYYPSLPVMGLRTLETPAINEEELIAFDTIYAYHINGTEFEELPSTTPTIWNGQDYNFFWSTNYYKTTATNNLFWATNFNWNGGTPDPLRYYNGTTWSDFTPLISNIAKPTGPANPDAPIMYNCLCIVPYKSRLCAFNIAESVWHWDAGVGAAVITLPPNNFAQRMRFSNKGSPITASSWDSVTPGNGGYVDIPTNEQIVSVEFVKDILLVKCERSSWKLVYTGNEVLPFVFQKINTELGAESTFSLVPFDNGVLAVGNVSITNDDGVSVTRIDQQIPNFVFNFSNNNFGPKRIHGIRDYAKELVYWIYPSFDEENSGSQQPTYPDKTLVYNYVNQSYSIYNESFTCLGYYQEPTDEVWSQLNYFTWKQWSSSWNSGTMQAFYPSIVGGNQQGFVEILAKDQVLQNQPSLTISSINAMAVTARITVYNNNLQSGDVIKITGIIGSYGTILNDKTYRVYIDPAVPNEVSIEEYIPASNSFVDVDLSTLGFTYIGGGVIQYISGINILTKIFAPFYEDSGQVRLGYIDFLLDKTEAGEVTSNVYIDENETISINDTSSTSGNIGLLGSNVLLTRPENTTLIPYQVNQDKIWHRIFVQTICQNFQIQLTMIDTQRANENISSNNFEMHAMSLYLSKNARLVQ